MTARKGLDMVGRKIAILMAVAAFAACLALAGCGGTQASSSASSSATSASSSASTAAKSSSTASAASSSVASTSAAPASSASASSAYIGETAAKEAALKHAGFAEGDVTKLEVKLDTDDATIHYDVEFKSGGKEYDYDIDPTTGNVLKSESKVDD